MRRALALLLTGAAALAGQNPPPRRLTLKEAEQIALQNHPRIGTARSLANAAGEIPTELRSAYFPSVSANLTGVESAANSRIAAGGLNNPIVYDRIAAGITVSQLITDFNRTSNLVASAKLRAKAQESVTEATRAQVVDQVDRAYYSVLRAQAVLTVARQTVEARQLVSDQVKTLADNKLKSNLDVSFANVNLSEARLLVADAENQLQAASMDLSTALGEPSQQQFELAEEPMPGRVPGSGEELARQAMGARPELAALRLEENAALRYVKAEHALLYPAVSALFTTGYTPAAQQQLSDRWLAAGVNVNVPIFNGKLYSARAREAMYRAEAARLRIRELENQIARDVRVAQLNALTAFERLSLTKQMLDQARMAYDLAQGRYELGLSSIIELSQAELNRTTAEINGVSAQYEYQMQRAILDYQLGVRH